MKKTGIVADRRFMDHITGPYHPESPERLASVYGMLEDEGLNKACALIPAREAGVEEICLVHEKSYVKSVAATEGRSLNLDADTPVSPKSYLAAKLAVGGVLNCVKGVIDGEIDNAFAIVRPPGHHAESGRGMGFCLFNNVAIGAKFALERHSLKRVLIVDWDLHHGNGTQNAFYCDPRALYFSTHQFPHYPGSGRAEDVGEGDGEGFTVNVPLPAGQGDEEYVMLFESLLKPIALDFRPELILVSAGFDIYGGDPLGGMNVTPDGFLALTRVVAGLADECCGGRIVVALEGGYHLQGLGKSVKMVLKGLLGDTESASGVVPPNRRAACEARTRSHAEGVRGGHCLRKGVGGQAGYVAAGVRKVQGRYWKGLGNP